MPRLELFPFRYRDRLTGKWVKARYVAERHEKLTDDVDALLDDIDEVLETNPEDFVRSFVQKGGQ